MTSPSRVRVAAQNQRALDCSGPQTELLFVEAGDALLTQQILAESSFPVRLHIARDGEQALVMLADDTATA